MSAKAGDTKNTTRQTTRKTTKKSARPAASDGRSSKGFTEEERAAMRERARELKAEARRGADRAAGESALLATVAALPQPDRDMATRLHALIRSSAPELSAKTWYGMPAYANEDGKVVCYFTPASKFKSRYATFGFNDDAKLDEGAMWPTSFALKEWTGAVEERIGALVKKAVG